LLASLVNHRRVGYAQFREWSGQEAFLKAWLKLRAIGSALSPAIFCPSAVSSAIALCCAYENAGAQTQMQGKTVGLPAPGGAGPTKPGSTKAKRADCVAQGKKQGLKGIDLTKLVKECVDKPT
jgi:hypothetical protein